MWFWARWAGRKWGGGVVGLGPMVRHGIAAGCGMRANGGVARVVLVAAVAALGPCGAGVAKYAGMCGTQHICGTCAFTAYMPQHFSSTCSIYALSIFEALFHPIGTAPPPPLPQP